MINILYISASFPKNENNEGIFVYKRCIHLLDKSINIKLVKPKIFLRKKLKIDLEKDYLYPNERNDQNPLFVKVFNVARLPASYRFLFFKIRLKRYVKRNNIDLVHCHFIWNSYAVITALVNYDIPIVVTSHGSDIHTFPQKRKRFMKETQFVLNHATQCIFVSDFLKSEAEKIVGKKPSFCVIPNGIDSFYKDKLINEDKSNKKRIVFIGRLEKIKRCEYLPDILSRLIESYKEIELHIIGDGSMKDLIFSKAKKLKVDNQIIFHGMVNHKDVFPILTGMDCMLLISKNEGWPCVVLEAQACGVPVVGTNNGGIPEAIGSGGIVVDDDNIVMNVSNAVIDVLRNPFDIKNLIDRASKFTWSKIVDKEVDVYKKILDE